MTQTKARRRRHPVAQARGTVELAGGSFDQITQRVHEFHRAISDIPFDKLAKAPAANLGSEPTRVVHDGITDGVYAAVRAGGGLLFGLASKALKIVEEEAAKQPPAPVTPGDATGAPQPAVLKDNVLSAVNGAFGDFLAARRNPLSVPLGFYHHGEPIALNPGAIAKTQVRMTPRVVIFLHGLCCNEHSWRLYQDEATTETTPYGDRLMADAGATPFYIRYNTGLHISQNGRAVARLIGKLVANYPVPVAEIILVGHSMGGLVARSACHYAETHEGTWTAKVTHVVCLGSPHLGAPLEKVVHAGTAVMDAFKLSRPWGELLKLRSLGIKDLRHGYAHHADWRGHHPDAGFDNRRGQFARLATARYHFIGASIGESADHWLGKVVGDGLVKLPSSTAREVADADTATLFGIHHMQLLNHPGVYRELRARLGDAPPATSPPKGTRAKAAAPKKKDVAKGARKAVKKTAAKAVRKTARTTARPE